MNKLSSRRKAGVLLVGAVLSLAILLSGLQGATQNAGSINLSFTIGNSRPLQFFQAAYWYQNPLGASLEPDAQWLGSHQGSFSYLIGPNIELDNSNHTFTQYLRRYAPSIKQLIYQDIYFQGNIGACITPSTKGIPYGVITPWCTHLMSVCDETCFLHVKGQPIGPTTRMHDPGVYYSADTVMFNLASPVIREQIRLNLHNLSTKGVPLWGCGPDSLCYVDWQTIPDGVFWDDAGNTFDNYGQSAEYCYPCGNITTWGQAEASWENAKLGFLQYEWNDFHSLGKMVVMNMGGWLYFTPNGSANGGAIVGNLTRFLQYTSGIVDEFQTGIAASSGPAYVFSSRLAMTHSLAMQGKSFGEIDLLALGTWGSGTGVDDYRRHRMVLAEGFLLQAAGVEVSEHEIDASYGTAPVSNSNPFSSKWQTGYQANIGVPVSTPNAAIFPGGTLWTQQYSNGFVALTMPASSSSPLNSAYTVKLPTNTTFRDTQTCNQLVGQTITLQNGDAAILSSKPTNCGLTFLESLPVFTPLLMVVTIAIACALMVGLKPRLTRIS